MKDAQKTFQIDRRRFVGGCAAMIGGLAFPRVAIGSAEPLLRFGVASDVHIHSGFGQERYLEKALRWFDSENVDAVVFPGDMSHTGRMSELQSLVSVWEKVFPGSRAHDGRSVERMLVTGNHEIGQWPGCWKGLTDEQLKTIRFDYDMDHIRSNWRALFGEEYKLIWKRVVKGFTFVGIQLPRPYHKPEILKFFKEHAAELAGDKPFFCIQHAHPAHTCYGEEPSSAWAELDSVRALSAFPNAVAISGHSHNSLCDERSVWQGAFTSIGAGAVIDGSPCYQKTAYANGRAPYDPVYKKDSRMKCFHQSGNPGRGCILVEVFADRICVKRRSLEWDEPLGADWNIGLPAVAGGEYDFSRRYATRSAPQFPKSAKVTLEKCDGNMPNVGPALKGKPCVWMHFPCAETVRGSRVFDYVVRILADGKEIARIPVLSYGYNLPEGRAHVEGEFIIGQHELPKGRKLVLSVVPRDCYGVTGRPLTSPAFEI